MELLKWKIDMEPENHLFQKDNHLASLHLVEMEGRNHRPEICFTMTKWLNETPQTANGENTIKLQLVGLDINFKSLKVRPVRLSWF